VCPHCRHAPLEINGIRSAVIFEGPIREAIHHLKYNGRTSLAEPLGELLIEYWRANPLPADLIVPVPLHQARLRERGYNQSTLLGERLARASGLPLVESALRRVKATVPQITLTAAQRQANVQDAFEARAELVQGQRVLLIDDVCTTGSTLEACQRALKRAGAQSVWALTLARAP
jgi:ComF family protein